MDRDERLRALAGSYRSMLRSPASAVAVAHLSRYCCAYRSTVQMDDAGRVDPLASAVFEGRRQVWIEMAGMANLTGDELRHIAEQGALEGAGELDGEGVEHE